MKIFILFCFLIITNPIPIAADELYTFPDLYEHRTHLKIN